ncbi:MAG: NADH-quinone oxidoreductase subunit L [Polyangiaceae bacterium]|nr:NADH-quinone oxidoreductase subunit L [Polyangiaceae bacterium]
MSPLYTALLCTFLPLAAALVLVLVSPLRRAGLAAGLFSVATALIAFGGAVTLLLERWSGAATPVRETVRWLPHAGLGGGAHARAVIELGVQIDGISATMLVVVTAVAACVQIFSLGYMAGEPKPDFGRYFTWQSLFLFSMNSLVVAPNLLQLFLGWELVGLVSYLLIGYWWSKPSAARAAMKAFWMTKLADMGLILALLVLFVDTGSFDWTVTTSAAGAVTLLLFFAVMGKSAQFPLHVWLPDAMEGPTPVSALLHAATMVAAGVFLVVRAFPLFEQAPTTGLVMAYVGAFTALFAAVIAVVQTDIKKVLAYSTCSQLGYMVAALGAGSQVGGFFHLTTHACFKALLFLAAGSIIHGVHSNELSHMGGLWSRMRVTSVAFLVGALALAGVPGLAGFFSKDLILEHVLERGLWAPLGALLVAAFLTAFYMGRVTLVALFGRPSAHAEHAHEGGVSLLAPLVVLAVPAAGVGWLGAKLSGLYAAPVHFHLSPVGMVATGLALAGLGLAYWMFGAPQGGGRLRAAFAPIGRLARSGAVNARFAWGYGVLGGVSSIFAWFDRYVIDGLMNGLGYATLALGARLRGLQTGRAQDYVYVLVAAMLGVGAYGAFWSR